MKRLALFILVCALGGCKSENRQARFDREEARARERGKDFGLRHQVSDSYAISRILKNGDIRTDADVKLLETGIRELSQKDLAALLDKVGKNRNIDPDRTVFTYAIVELANRSPETVMSWFPPGEISAEEPGSTSVMGVLASSRPDILRDWLSKELVNAPRDVQTSWLSMGIGCLGKDDPASALAFSKTLPPGAVDNRSVILGIFPHYGRISPGDAAAAAKANYKGEDLSYALYNIASVIGDPEDRMKFASDVPDQLIRGKLLEGSLSQLLTSDREAALRNLAELSPRDLQATLGSNLKSPDSLLKRLCASDSEALTKLLNHVVASSSTEPLFLAAVEGLATRNPGQAAELIASMPEGEMKGKMLDSQFRALAQNDPTIAIGKASQLPEGGSRNRAYSSIGRVLGELGLDKAVAAGDAMKPSDQEAFFETALMPVSMNDPKAAAEFLSGRKLALKSSGGQQLLEMLGAKLSAEDPSYASQWIVGLPADQQPGAMKGIATQMARSDISHLGSLLSSMPQDESWATGVRILVDNIKNSDPEMAGVWREHLASSGYGK